MRKLILIFLTFIFTSMYYFPVTFNVLPGYNTKMMMAVPGIILFFYYLIKKRNAEIKKNILYLFVFAGIVSLVGLFSMTYNGTIDDAYSGYVASMAVWLSAAFVVCNMIRWTHGKITVKLMCHYLMAVCLMQCASALLIDNSETFAAVANSILDLNQDLHEEVNRLYGLGASLDVAGIRFSLVLISITVLINREMDTMPTYAMVLYTSAFMVISLIGSMMARTTYVGIGLSAGIMAFWMIKSRNTVVRRSTVKYIGILIGMIAITVLVSIPLYRNDVGFKHWIRFAFEGFFNYFEKGEYSIATTETLKDMIVFPDNFKTWIIGDGYFSNPYWSDPNYIWQGQNKQGFYMGTDIGYLRFIFYFGIIGLVAFSLFIIQAGKTCAKLLDKYQDLFFFATVAGFIIWFKVATDIFLFLALFICLGNMQRNDEEMNDEADEKDKELAG